MPIMRFRVYFEEDETIYRDVAIRHDQTFFDLHTQILNSYEFDSKHEATFYRSNDNWLKGREISLARYGKEYKMEPLIMSETTIVSEIRSPNQKFLYHYDFKRLWPFMVELIGVTGEPNPKLTYPATVRVEGIGPSQYGTKSILGDRFVDVEEKYDLAEGEEGFGEESEGGGTDDSETTDAESDQEDAF